MIYDIDGLRQPVKGTDIEVNQIEAGPFRGSLTHGTFGNFSVSLGRFSRAVRSRGVLSKNKQVVGMLLGRGRPVSHWSFDIQPGDIFFDHLAGDHEGSYKGSASFATIAFGPSDLTGLVKGEAAISDFDFWQRRTLIRPDAAIGRAIVSRFETVIEKLERELVGLSGAGSDFWTRALIECFITAASNGIPWDGNSGPVRSSVVIRQIDDLLEEYKSRPVHISEICETLNLSRRTLHRSFAEVLGIGPVTYLRKHRLNAARRALKHDEQAASISQLAWSFGFDDVGRFAGYYRRLFGEKPSDTARQFAKSDTAR